MFAFQLIIISCDEVRNFFDFRILKEVSSLKLLVFSYNKSANDEFCKKKPLSFYNDDGNNYLVDIIL